MSAICILLLSLSSDVYADFYARGNAAYREGNFAEAAAAYEQLAASGAWNGEVYFNLGNAYYHQGDLGRAVLNYERATAIDSGFQPARRNLDLAIAATAHKLGRPPGFSLGHQRPSWVPGLTQAALRGGF